MHPVRLSVGADDSRAVDGKQNRQLLDSDIVDQLIVGALQEGRVDSHHRLVVADRRAGGERHRVLFRNRHIEILVRVFSGKLDHARAFAHSRRNGHQLAVFRRGFAQPVAKNFRVGGQAAAAFRQDSAGMVKFRHRVEGNRVFSAGS